MILFSILLTAGITLILIGIYEERIAKLKRRIARQTEVIRMVSAELRQTEAERKIVESVAKEFQQDKSKAFGVTMGKTQIMKLFPNADLGSAIHPQFQTSFKPITLDRGVA